MTIPYADIQTLDPGGLVVLYELDLAPIGVSENGYHYFSPHANELGQPITWGGHAYLLLPIEAEGFALTSKGALPRPKLRVGNLTGLFTTLCLAHEDLIGARLIRRRVLARHLPAENFAAGVNPTADANIAFEPEIWWVDRKTHESRVMVEWELASPFDLQGITLPRRLILRGPCMWVYKGPDCGYTGAGGWDRNDNPCPLSEDACGKRVASCQRRFPAGALPYGGFPGVGQTSV